jgi:septum formation protein
MLLPLINQVFNVVSVDVDETPRPGESAPALAERLAIEKAERACEERIGQNDSELTVLAADTVVSLGDRPLGKPQDEQEARSMLRALRGGDHEVITGVAVRQPNGPRTYARIVQTRVRMRDYSDREINAYIASGEPFDKAGAYAIQDPEFRPVRGIHGCLPNVVGLPLCAVRSLLDRQRAGPDALPHPPCDLCEAADELLRRQGLWSPPELS